MEGFTPPGRREEHMRLGSNSFSPDELPLNPPLARVFRFSKRETPAAF